MPNNVRQDPIVDRKDVSWRCRDGNFVRRGTDRECAGVGRRTWAYCTETDTGTV